METKQLTVKALIKHLAALIKEHPELLNKKIVISDDVEGNSYHGLWYGITYGQEAKDCIEFSNGVCESSNNYDDLVILG